MALTLTAAMMFGLAGAAPLAPNPSALAVTLGEGRLGLAAAAARADDPALCTLLRYQNRLAEAAACLRRRLQVAPDDMAAWGALGLVTYRQGDFTAAADAYTHAAKPGRAALAKSLAGAGGTRITLPGGMVTVPFLHTDPLPILRARLSDRREHLFVLDTGAAETVLDPGLAQTLGVAPVSAGGQGVFAGGKTAGLRYGVLGRFSLGGMTAENIPVLLLPTRGFAAALDGVTVEGVIGVDVLRHFVSTIDYPRGRLVLAKAAPAGPGQVPFWIGADHLLLAEAAIDGVRELAVIDTGLAGQGCTLPASTLTAIGQKADGAPVAGVGGGGPTQAVAFTARDITLAGETRANIGCLYGPFPAQLEHADGTHIGLLVSHAFLKPYAVTFDFNAMRLTLAHAK